MGSICSSPLPLGLVLSLSFQRKGRYLLFRLQTYTHKQTQCIDSSFVGSRLFVRSCSMTTQDIQTRKQQREHKHWGHVRGCFFLSLPSVSLHETKRCIPVCCSMQHLIHLLFTLTRSPSQQEIILLQVDCCRSERILSIVSRFLAVHPFFLSFIFFCVCVC